MPEKCKTCGIDRVTDICDDAEYEWCPFCGKGDIVSDSGEDDPEVPRAETERLVGSD